MRQFFIQAILVSVLCVQTTSVASESWENVIPKVSARADYLQSEAEERGFDTINTRDGDDGWKQAYRPEHRCAILGRMLGVPKLIASLEVIDEPEIHTDMSDWDILHLYATAQSLHAWVKQANTLFALDVSARVDIWNENCLGGINLTNPPFFVATTGPDFDAKAVSVPTQQSNVMPDFDGRDKWARSFRTRIRDGIESGANFAGHYSVIMFGCGASCRAYFVADTQTGEVFATPFGGEATIEITTSFELESAIFHTYYVKDSYHCALHTWSFENNKFTLAHEQLHPRGDKGCNRSWLKVVSG